MDFFSVLLKTGDDTPGLPRWFSGKEFTCQCRRLRRHGFDPEIRKILWSRKWQPSPVFLPEKSHEQRSLAGYSLWGCKESDTTVWLSACVHTHTHTHGDMPGWMGMERKTIRGMKLQILVAARSWQKILFLSCSLQTWVLGVRNWE